MIDGDSVQVVGTYDVDVVVHLLKYQSYGELKKSYNPLIIDVLQEYTFLRYYSYGENYLYDIVLARNNRYPAKSGNNSFCFIYVFRCYSYISIRESLLSGKIRYFLIVFIYLVCDPSPIFLIQIAGNHNILISEGS